MKRLSNKYKPNSALSPTAMANVNYIVTLLLGSNLGDSNTLLNRAVDLIESNVGVVIKRTKVLENEPNGFDSEHLFYNQIILVQTVLSPHELLEVLEDIERQLGRIKPCCNWRLPREYSDRTMDIDILYYGDRTISDDKLEIPHLKIEEREFVLQLLDELNSL